MWGSWLQVECFPGLPEVMQWMGASWWQLSLGSPWRMLMVEKSVWRSLQSLPSPLECHRQVWGLCLSCSAVCEMAVFLCFGHLSSATARKTFLLLSDTYIVPFLTTCYMELCLRVHADPSPSLCHQHMLVEAHDSLGNVCR